MKKLKLSRTPKIIVSISLMLLFVLIIVAAVTSCAKSGAGDGKDSVETSANPADPGGEKPKKLTKEEEKANLIAEADRLALSYDYDGAIVTIQTWAGYESDTQLTDKIASYEATKATLVPVNMDEVTHIFYHSLIVDPSRGFANHETNAQAQGMNQWMTTVDEFNKVTQTMYEEGYVLVSIHDLMKQTTDANGQERYEPATILLPPGKKAFVMSQDDLSYYHAYDGYGIATKMVLDENGKPTNEYIDKDGKVVYGAYDVVPLLDQFIEEHPDASYMGAKGIIALTGYNGILGYRTDESYTPDWPDLNSAKKQWMADNPGFTIENERAEAKKVADAMKAEGWEFASHTWGHLHADTSTVERLTVDQDKWKRNVEPLVGPVDTVIFAHGADLGPWGNYDVSGAKFQMFFNAGYRIFCNVDSNQYRTWFGTNGDYVRQGRRNIDGYRLYYNAIGTMHNLDDLINAKDILDPARPPVKPLT